MQTRYFILNLFYRYLLWNWFYYELLWRCKQI